MKCAKCKQEFNENYLQLSHDVPRYVGGQDKDGRHNLCKTCHEEYELRTAFIIAREFLTKEQKKAVKNRLIKRAENYFK